MTRVVVTGIGLVTPVGCGREAAWPALLEGRSGIGPVTSFDTAEYPVHVGAEVKAFNPAAYFRRQDPQRMGRASQLAVSAARLALDDARLEPESWRRSRVGVVIGTTSGEALVVQQYNDIRKASDLASIPGGVPGLYPSHVIPRHVASEFGALGPCLTIPTACAAGNYAIGYGFDLVRAGRLDLALTGGADPFTRITYSGFARLGAIAPERCQPFDRNRKGMIPGEGAAIIVLEALDRAIARRAPIYAEILGYGLTCDAHHMTAGHPQGDGAARAMCAALASSRVDRDEVDYISAHGTGTLANDRVESLALRSVFGPRAERLPMSSIKSMIGHTMGAASAIEAAACALALSTGVVPPTINYESPDSECPVDCVPNTARELHPRIVLNNAYAFGGNNASLCMARFERGSHAS